MIYGPAFLITEYCGAAFFMGWHIYLRDNKNRQQRNVDGDWGWLNRSHYGRSSAERILAELGIMSRGDNSCDDGAFSELSRRFPIGRQRIWKKPRGCIPVIVGEYGEIKLATSVPDDMVSEQLKGATV